MHQTTVFSLRFLVYPLHATWPEHNDWIALLLSVATQLPAQQNPTHIEAIKHLICLICNKVLSDVFVPISDCQFNQFFESIN